MNPLATHLGERVSSLADGELSHSARDRALAHVAICESCRAELERERAARALLRGLPDPAVVPSLAARLQAIAAAPTLAPRAPELAPVLAGHHSPAAARSARPARPQQPAPRPEPSGRSARSAPHPRRRTRVVATGAISLAVVVLGGAAMMAGESGPDSPTQELLRPSASVTAPSAGLSVVTTTFMDPGLRRLAPAGAGQMVPASALTVPSGFAPMLAPVGR